MTARLLARLDTEIIVVAPHQLADVERDRQQPEEKLYAALRLG